MIITRIRGLITPLIPTHEPPSVGVPKPEKPATAKAGRRLDATERSDYEVRCDIPAPLGAQDGFSCLAEEGGFRD